MNCVPVPAAALAVTLETTIVASVVDACSTAGVMVGAGPVKPIATAALSLG